jgi:hypothetical protein
MTVGYRWESEMLSAFLARPPREPVSPQKVEVDFLWQLLSLANEGQIVVVASRKAPAGKEEVVAGIPGGHAYSVLGTERDRLGERWVTLRNPWGHYSPQDLMRRGDGVFSLPIETLYHVFDFATVTLEK